MNRRTRRSIAIAACAGLLSLSGCALGGTREGQESPAPQPKATGLKDFDTCTVLSQEELAAAGVGGPGERVEHLSFEPGCSFEGDVRLLALYKNQDQTVTSYATGGSWDSYDQIDINGRDAARAVSSGSTDQGICNVLVNAGGGVVIVSVSGILRDDVPDPCGEAEKIARQVEPRLPR
ncbi:DUF3558 domain-containing protein [Saccharopolyspora sp. NPDC047091]|uniref:DUF3558 domain-containing protein n=1 Tax=Saccharopolyspora sp. NPDC047091 TaxID=3155924 RepID=UPI0033C5B286